jgi:hypothetical protein
MCYVGLHDETTLEGNVTGKKRGRQGRTLERWRILRVFGRLGRMVKEDVYNRK